MMRAVKLILLVVLMLAAAERETRASQIFDYSFTGDSGYGGVAGTITGEIILPFTGNGTGAATEVTANGYPANFAAVADSPVNAVTWNQPSVYLNSFTVTNGHLTAAQFQAQNEPAPTVPYDTVIATLSINTILPYLDDQDYFLDFAEYVEGTPTFTFQPNASPEPVSITLLASGFLAVGAFRLVRRRPGLTAGSRPAC